MPLAQTLLPLYYEVHGGGPPVLLISGTGANLKMRPSIVEDPALIEFQLLCYEHRGLGRSAPAPETSSMADYADDAARLLDYLRCERAHVLGTSFGGMVAQHFALRHPERLERLVLVCTSSGGGGGSSYPLHDLLHLSEAERWLAVLPQFDTRPEQVERMKKFAPALLAQLVHPETDAGARTQLRARANHDTWQVLSRLRSPTLVCAGRYDGVTPFANSLALVSRIRGARLAVFEGGHSCLLQDRRALPTIAGFLREGSVLRSEIDSQPSRDS
jgi:3-oxoadipate enol-lactonase